VLFIWHINTLNGCHISFRYVLCSLIDAVKNIRILGYAVLLSSPRFAHVVASFIKKIYPLSISKQSLLLHDNMCYPTVKTSSCPATEALDRALNSLLETRPCFAKEKPMICIKNLKRSRSSEVVSFDMSAFTEASQQVEDSVAFPSIEWSFGDDDSDDEDYASPPAPKRRCGGLVRSNKHSFDLSSLSGGSSQSLR
jgi:hypothetical protein